MPSGPRLFSLRSRYSAESTASDRDQARDHFRREAVSGQVELLQRGRPLEPREFAGHSAAGATLSLQHAQRRRAA